MIVLIGIAFAHQEVGVVQVATALEGRIVLLIAYLERRHVRHTVAVVHTAPAQV
ncbi:MAG: hypothetical protein ABIO43_03220 [Sphingomicrobium sp.]